MLTAEVTQHECELCGFSYSDSAAEVARHESVCRHLGVLSPAEIKQIRERQGLNRAQFAHLTKIGTASLARWESGTQIQNAAMDQYLRLLSHDEVLAMLSADNAAKRSFSFAPQFRYLRAPSILELREQSKTFRLRKTA
jgi:DNA-binding transcriptional regulator YiaG